MDIEINARSSLFVNFKSNLKFVSTKVYVTQPIGWGLEKPQQPIREAGKFKISFVGNWQREKKKEKSGLRRKLKVSTLNIQI